MTILIFIFVACVVAMFAAIWVYNQAESTAFDKTMAKIDQVNSRVEELDKLLASNVSTTAGLSLKLKTLDHVVTCQTGFINKNDERISNINATCDALKEQMIDLKMTVASKRPVTTVKGPLQVEIITQQDIQNSRQELQKKAKEVAKKIKELRL